MKKSLFNIFYVIGAVLCGCSCHEKKIVDSAFITKDYDFVLGFAVPDEDRQVPTEIFIGRMLDREPDSITIYHGMQDGFLLFQVQRYQSWYRTAFEYIDDAEVNITSDDQNVGLQYVGFGTYRDIENALHIEPLKKYTLSVARPGKRLYTKEVTVPGNIQITNIAEGDTVISYPKKELPTANICLKLYPIIHNPVPLAHLYRHKESNNGPGLEPDYKSASFHNDNQAIPVLIEPCSDRTYINFNWEILALDSSATKFYRSERIAANKDVFDFLDYYDLGNIENRSSLNTHGADDAIGNFGAYNAVRTHFTAKALRDSCVCD